MGTIKFAVSISEEEYRELEDMRKEEGLSRSGIVAEAIRFFKEFRKKKKLVRLYEEGYKKTPEKLTDIKAWERVSAETFSKEGWR